MPQDRTWYIIEKLPGPDHTFKASFGPFTDKDKVNAVRSLRSHWLRLVVETIHVVNIRSRSKTLESIYNRSQQALDADLGSDVDVEQMCRDLWRVKHRFKIPEGLKNQIKRAGFEHVTH